MIENRTTRANKALQSLILETDPNIKTNSENLYFCSINSKALISWSGKYVLIQFRLAFKNPKNRYDFYSDFIEFFDFEDTEKLIYNILLDKYNLANSGQFYDLNFKFKNLKEELYFEMINN